MDKNGTDLSLLCVVDSILHDFMLLYIIIHGRQRC